MAGLRVPLSTLRRRPRDRRRMTRGQDDWLGLSCTTLSFATLCRFSTAHYAIRLKANAVLERHIAHLLKRPVGRPSKTPKVFYHGFRYRAQSWDRDRRVVAKVEWRAGELFPRVGFVVTNLRRSPKRIIKFYNGRGTAEQWTGISQMSVDLVIRDLARLS